MKDLIKPIDCRDNDENVENIDEIIEKVKERNYYLLELFQKELEKKKLSEKTIFNHLKNINFFLNYYLVYQDLRYLNQIYGIFLFDDFLGDWFIRKALWSDERTLKQNATSIKKFYTFLGELGLIEDRFVKMVKNEIKEKFADMDR